MQFPVNPYLSKNQTTIYCLKTGGYHMRKKLTALCLGLSIALCAPAMGAKADSSKVVTIGANLSEAQREKIFEYFGVDETSVEVLEITNKDERAYLEGVASEAQIGHRTYSCAYIEPTEKGKGINIKTANLSWVTSYMIKSTLTTAGIYDCNVLAAAPFQVSGTGALTGIMKAFESVTGEPLEEEKKELATEELVMTGELADEIGSEQATGIVTDVKDSVIGQNIVQADKIEQVIIDSSTNYNVNLTQDQIDKIAGVMEKVSEQDYDYDRLSETFKSIKDSTAEKLGIDMSDAQGVIEKIKEFFVDIFNWFKNLFASEDAKEETNTDVGILNQTNDDVLGADAIIDSTEDSTPIPEATATPEEATQTPEETVAPTEEVAPEASEETNEDSVNSPSFTGEDNGATDEIPLEETQQ